MEDCNLEPSEPKRTALPVVPFRPDHPNWRAPCLISFVRLMGVFLMGVPHP